MDDATILTPPNIPRGGDASRERDASKGGGSNQINTDVLSTSNQVVDNLLDLDEGGEGVVGSQGEGGGGSGSGTSNGLDWLLTWTNAATATPASSSSSSTNASSTTGAGSGSAPGLGLGLEATAAATATMITFEEEEEGPLDRLVGTTRVS